MAQLQFLEDPFSTTYEKYCKEKGITVDIVRLPSGAEAFWVGDKTAETIVVHFHGGEKSSFSVEFIVDSLPGGGFVTDGNLTHLSFWDSVRNQIGADNDSLAIFYPRYSLVPHSTYPTQLIECIEALNYLFQELGRSASDVIIAGDSAGGNLAVALLSQIMHPNTKLPALELDKPLKGMILISPWILFSMDYSSAKKNLHKDSIPASICPPWGAYYLAGESSSPYNEPVIAPPEWWKDAKVEQVLALAGTDELFLDSITEWVEKFKVRHKPSATYPSQFRI